MKRPRRPDRAPRPSRPAKAPAGLIGAVVDGRFAVREVLGRGGMGVVYLAEDRDSGAEVALKHIPVERLGGGGASLLRAEFEALARLSHPGLCRAFDFGEAPDGGVYYTQEVARGPTLADAFRGCREGEPEARAAAFQDLYARLAELVRVLAYVHDEGLIHHDIKPDNIIVPPGGPLKLIDFGLATERRARAARGGGTIAYAAPERIEGRPGDRRSDLYALGATLYEVVTGVPPFRGSARSVMRAHCVQPPMTTRAFNPDVPLRLERAIIRLLRKSPEARFEGALECGAFIGVPVPAERIGGRVEVQLLDTGFQGREREQRRALAALRPARLGAGSVALLVTGETGIGKSAFIRRVAQRAQVRGFRARALGPLCSGALGPGDVRARAEALGELARRGPLLLLADELDRAPAALAWALAEVVRRALASSAGGRIAVVLGATNPGALEPPLRDLLLDLDARRRLSRLGLEPLPASAVERMVGCALGVSSQSDHLRRRRLVGQLAQRLREHIGGNPLWVTEALAEWRRAGFLKPKRAGRGRPKLIDAPRIRSIDAAVAVRLQALSGPARGLADLLAAHDGPCPLPRLFEAAGDGPGLGAALLALEASGLCVIQRDARGRERLAWAHAGFGAAAAARVKAAGGLEVAHDALRRAYEREAKGARRRPSGRATRLARRARHGLEGTEPARHAALGLGASCLLRQAGRLDEAEALARLALRHTPPERFLLRGALLEQQAKLVDLRGDPLRARELFMSALAALGDRGPAHGAVRIRLGLGLSFLRSRHLPEARRQLVSAARESARLGRDGYRAGALLALSSVARHQSRLRRAGALLRAAELVNEGRRGGSRGRRVQAQILHMRGVLLERRHDVVGAFAAYRDALGFAARAPDRVATAAILMDLAAVAQRLGRGRLARTLSVVACRRAAAADALPTLGAVLYRRACAAWRDGRVREARRLFGRAAKVFELHRDHTGEIRSVANQAHAALECGRLGDALSGFQRAVGDAAALGRRPLLADARVGLALAATAAGDLPAARRALDGASELGEEANALQQAERLEAEALYLQEKGDLAEAAAAGERAFALRGGRPASADAVTAALAQAERLVALRDLPAARRVLVGARADARKVGTRRHRVRVGLVAGLIALEERKPERALRHLLKGLAALRADPERAWRLHEAVGRAYDASGDPALGLAHRGRARRTAEQLRDTLPPELHDAFGRRRGLQRLLLEAMEQAAQEAAGARAGAGEGADPGLAPLAEALLKVNRAIVAERDLRRLLDLILDGAISLTGAERGFLLLRGRKGRMRFKVGRDIAKDDLRKGAQKISHSIAQQVLERGVSVVVDDAADDDRFAARKSVQTLGLASVLCVPLVLRGEVLGVIYLDHRFRKAAFGSVALKAAEAMADQAGVALENARLFEENQKQRERLERQNERLEASVERRDLQIAEYQRALEDIRPPKHRYEEFAGRSRPMLALLTQLDRAAAVSYPALVSGESGVGKELCARAIHRCSPRRGRPFVVENCAAIPEGLLEAELFGAVKGSYTGATHDRIGLIEAADGGTLFLDEVAEMSPGMQAKLLRVLEHGEVRAVGAERLRRVDIRIIAATNKDLAEEVKRGRFREDLYYRLKVLEIRVPALRERTEDIPALAERVFRELTQKGDTRAFRLSPDALEALERHAWPGNVRQLRNELMRAATLTAGGVIELAHLSSDIQRGASSAATLPLLGEVRLDDQALERAQLDAERRVLLLALDRCQQNRTRCAELLGISRFGLQKRLKRCGIPLKRGPRKRAATR